MATAAFDGATGPPGLDPYLEPEDQPDARIDEGHGVGVSDAGSAEPDFERGRGAADQVGDGIDAGDWAESAGEDSAEPGAEGEPVLD